VQNVNKQDFGQSIQFHTIILVQWQT